MKRILFLLLTAASAVADAQQVHRCPGNPGSPVTYRDTSCLPSAGASERAAPAPDPPDTARPPFLESPAAGPGIWHTDQPIDQRLRTRHATLAIAALVLEREQSENNRKAVQYAENRARCKEAMRVADLCGKFEGLFACDDKGFLPVVADAAHKPAAMDGASRTEMDRCVRDAAKQRP